MVLTGRGTGRGRTAANDYSPVLVVAADTAIGLAVTRSLARRGVPVYCASSTRDALGARSRYCQGWFSLPRDEKQAIDAILDHGRRWKAAYLIGISEGHITLMNRWRSSLSGQFTLLFPPQEIFERALKKHLTLAFAERAGIRIPHTLRPQLLAEAESCRFISYPVVLKMSHRDLPDGQRMEFPHKSLVVRSYAELLEVLRPLTPGCYPMIQEYIPGSGAGVSMLMRNGRPLMAFQHRRIREHPPGGGVSVYCESVPPDPELVARSERLLREMEWEGVAMVEYRGDPARGEFVLMEVNGRFWGSLGLAIAAGADFPYWLYRTASRSCEETPPRTYRAGIRMRSLAGDTKWLLETVREAPARLPSALLQYLAGFRPSTRYFVWDWNDPMPALWNLLGRFRLR